MSEKHVFMHDQFTPSQCRFCGLLRSAACHEQGEAADFGGIKFVSKQHMPDGEMAVVGGDPNPLIVRDLAPAASQTEQEKWERCAVIVGWDQHEDRIPGLTIAQRNRILALADECDRLRADLQRYAGENSALTAEHISLNADLLSMTQERDAKDAEIKELQTEYDGVCALIDRQATLLTGVVNAVRGEPPSNTLWSHHDAPELVRGVVVERDELVRDLSENR